MKLGVLRTLRRQGWGMGVKVMTERQQSGQVECCPQKPLNREPRAGQASAKTQLEATVMFLDASSLFPHLENLGWAKLFQVVFPAYR